MLSVLGIGLCISKSAPTKDRWRWYVDYKLERAHGRERRRFGHISRYLAARYKSASQVTAYLVGLEELISPAHPWAMPPIVDEWVRLRPAVFRKLRNSMSLWRKTPERFQLQIDYALSSISRSHLAKVAGELLLNPCGISPQRLSSFLNTVRAVAAHRQAKEWLAELIERGDDNTRMALTGSLVLILEKWKDSGTIFTFLTEVLRRQRKIDTIIDQMSTALHWSKGSV